MARARDPNRDKAFEIYKEHQGNISNREIAKLLECDEKILAVWKGRDKWQQKLEGNVVQQSDNNVVQQTNDNDEIPLQIEEPPRKDGRVKKRSGNPNPPNQFTKRNRAAMIHGLRSKFLFDEQIEIMEALQEFDVVDQLWLQIELSFAAIIRAQKIMWVENPFDHLSEQSSYSSGEGGSGEAFKVVYAHERFESFIKAQTRAFAEHRNLIKQFLDLTTEDDERRLKLQQMQESIKKTKAETEFEEMRAAKLRGDKKDTSLLDALIEGRKQYEQMKQERGESNGEA